MIYKLINCSDAVDGSKFPSPFSCSEFFECDHGIAYQFECPQKHGKDGYERLLFDPELQVCNWPSEVDCDIDNSKTSVASRSIKLPIDTEQKDGSSMIYKLIDCSDAEPGSKFPSPFSCSEFYECDHGIAYQFECPQKHGEDGYERLLFDSELQVCNWPSEVDCDIDNNNTSVASRSIKLPIDTEQKDGSSMIYKLIDCSDAVDGAKFPSPFSCSEFYECDHGIAYQFECPPKHGEDGYERLLFDPELQACNW